MGVKTLKKNKKAKVLVLTAKLIKCLTLGMLLSFVLSSVIRRWPNKLYDSFINSMSKYNKHKALLNAVSFI